MANNTEVLDFQLDVDVKEALRQIERFQKEMASSLKHVAQAAEKMGKTAGASADRAAKATDSHTKAVKGVTRAYNAEASEVRNLKATIRALEDEAKNADEGKAGRIQERIDQLRKERTERQRTARGLDKKQGFIGRDQSREIKSSLKESGEALVEPLRAFLARDAKGFVEASMKGIGKTFSKDTARALGKGGLLAKQQGALLDIAGKRKGGLQGLAMRGSGKAQKAFGAGMGGMGKALSGITKALAPLGKLIPIFSMFGGLLMMIVKTFIDADQMVKEFNKGVLESASTIGHLATYGSQGMSRLEEELESVAKAAHNFEFNNRMGITKDQHMQVLNVLTQEGVALDYMSRQADKTKKSMGELTQSIVASGVAYGRALGVPLQEINQLQAEMITEMGSSLQDTEMAFAQITRAAGESGVAGNKFFQMIKGVSQDLSVWNMRMEDSVDLLGKMSKIMSPRSAQKFFQEMSSGFKQLGRQDLLKQAIFAGAKATKEANQGTLQRMEADLAKSLNVEVGEISGKGFDELYKMVQKSENIDPSQMNTMNQRLNELATVRQGSKGGTYGQAYATRHADTAGQLGMLKSALEVHGGSLEDPTTMNIGAIADAMGKSPEFVEALSNLARTAKAQKKMMLEDAETPEERARIEGMSEDELINELGKTMLPKSDEDMKKSALKAAEQQGQLTQDLLTKFSNFVDHFMVQFYYLVMDVFKIIKDLYNSVVSSKLFGDSFDKGERAGGREGKALSALLKEAGGTKKVKEAVEQTMSGDQFLKMMKDSGASEQQVERARRFAGGKKAGEYDVSQTLTSAGISDFNKVFQKALWALDKRKDSDAFVDKLNLGGPGIDAPTPEGLTGPPSKSTGAPKGSPRLKGDDDLRAEDLKLSEATAEVTKTNAKTQQDQLKVMKNQGIVINDKGAKNIADEFLTAMRKALYEYYLYSGTDRSVVAKAFGQGPTAGSMAKFMGGAATGTPDGALAKMAAEARPNAKGGLVTGIANGMAIVAAQGEGLASVGRGEQIVPAGGGGSNNITIPVSGIGGQDLARLIEGKVVEGIREFKRRERLN